LRWLDQYDDSCPLAPWLFRIAHNRCIAAVDRARPDFARLRPILHSLNYCYSGTEPGTNATFVIFGVAEVGKAVKVFEQAAAARPSA
jgi:DNA-directed RNA polymerase specialized sigma24 family protein